MPAFSMTCHAAIRANQRGITHQMIADLLAHADVEAPVGDGGLPPEGDPVSMLVHGRA